MAVSLSPLDDSMNLAAWGPATIRPLMGICDSIAVQDDVGEVVCGIDVTTSWRR
jgi:hypothetical protein